MRVHNMWKRGGLVLVWMVFALPVLVWGQSKPWSKTIELQDRRDAGQMPVVARVTFHAYSMMEMTSPGQPIMMGANDVGETIRFPGMDAGYVRFKITKIEWDSKSGYDGSPDYKVIVRNSWVQMSPRIYLDGRKGGNADNLRKRYITAPNVEYVKGDSLPPPTIFKIDKNGSFAFTIGVKAVTPKTVEEKPFDFTFNFGVEGLVSSVVEEIIVLDTIKEEKDDTLIPEPPRNTDDIDNAVKVAIENEDAEGLIELIREHNDVESVRNARSYLALKMTRELVDSMTYRLDISYAKFTRAAPTEDQLTMAYSRLGAAIGKDFLGAAWRDGKLYVRPPDTVDYVITAQHKITNENKTSITLNRKRDNIKFSYADAATDPNRVQVRIKGGEAPYVLNIKRYAEGVYFPIEGAYTVLGDTVLDKEKIARVFKLKEEGDYAFDLVDHTGLKQRGLGTVHIVPPPPIPPIVWYIAAGVLVAFLVIFLLIRREQRRKDEELEKLLEARGGSDPRVKRKPKPELQRFWKETAISDLSLHKNFVREIATYLKERPHYKSDKPLVEGVLLGTVLKFDFENEQYEVRLDRFRAIEPRPLDHYEDSGDMEKWPEIREVTEDHRDLVKIGWLQVAEGRPMRLSKLEQQFQDEQFSELFQLLLKIDFVDGQKLCAFFTRTTSGKINDVNDRQEGVDYWLNWDELEDAGYYETTTRPVRDENGEGKIKVRMKNQETA
jgi:hypothetical protein